MSAAPPAFSIALSHAKPLFEAQAVQLQIKNQAIFSSGPVSLHSWCRSQLPFLHCLRLKCNLLPRLYIFPRLYLLSQGIIPPFLLSISGLGLGTPVHHLSWCSSSRGWLLLKASRGVRPKPSSTSLQDSSYNARASSTVGTLASCD